MAAKKQQTTYTLQDALQQMITNYNNTPTWKSRTAAERNQIAQDEYSALYDQYRLNAQQAYDTNDLALQQQRAGIADTYNQQREQSAQNYRQAVSDSDRAMLQRGLQRSTYGAQLANGLRQKGIDAQQALWEAQGKAEMNIDQQRALAAKQLAQQLQQYGNSEASEARKYARQLEEQDYERGLQGAQYQNQLFGQIYNALAQQEQNAQEQERWNQQFEYQKERDTESDRRYNEEQAYQRERDLVGDQRYADQFAYQQARDTVSDTQWQQQFEQQIKQWENSNNQWERELAEQIRQFNVLHPEQQTATGGGGGGYSGSGKKSGSGTGTAKNTQTQTNTNSIQSWMDEMGLNGKDPTRLDSDYKATQADADKLKKLGTDIVNFGTSAYNTLSKWLTPTSKTTTTTDKKKTTTTTTTGKTDHRGNLI